LKEGNITYTASGSVFSAKGDTAANYAFASVLKEGDIVALSDDTANTYAATGGLPVVGRGVTTETFMLGRIVTSPDWIEDNPTATQDTWADMLTNKYYRVADVEIWAGITKIMDAVVQLDGTNGVAIGVATTLNINLADCYANQDLRFITAAGNGTGVIPFHYIADAEAGDLATILVGIIGPMYSVTGS